MKKNNKNLKFNKSLFLLGLVILAVFAVVLGANLSHKKYSRVYTYANSETSVLGASTNINGVLVSVDGTQTDFKATSLNKDMKKLSVSFTLTNNSGERIEFSPGMNLFLFDDLGKSYQPTMKFSNSETVIGGPVLAGQSLGYTLDFELPLDSNFSRLEYK